MSVARNKSLEVTQRRQQVAELYLKGFTQTHIAIQLEVSQATVSDDLWRIKNDWRRSAVQDIDLVRKEELLKLARVEREAWSAWERSQKPEQSARVSGQGSGERTEKRFRNKYGDPRFLDQILKCIAARREILGLDAPTKIAPVTPDGVEPAKGETLSWPTIPITSSTPKAPRSPIRYCTGGTSRCPPAAMTRSRSCTWS